MTVTQSAFRAGPSTRSFVHTILPVLTIRPPSCRNPSTLYGLPRSVAQVVANVILGRSHLGVHYRMDGVYGALMGETSAIRRLQQVLNHESLVNLCCDVFRLSWP